MGMKLAKSYTLKDEAEMSKEITGIIDICRAAGNKHFNWFANLLENHFEGIIAHAYYHVSSGKVEGVNNMIKTVRRQAYGYPDDEYFFLKIYDASRRSYVRNPKSHKICD
jgi:Transposase and inactivated derivatives